MKLWNCGFEELYICVIMYLGRCEVAELCTRGFVQLWRCGVVELLICLCVDVWSCDVVTL